MPDLFISYSSRDREQIRPIVTALQAAGIDVWWDQMIIEGADWSHEIEKALDASRQAVAFISRNVMHSEAWHVLAEIARAHRSQKLVPIKIGEFTMTLAIEGYVLGRQMVFAADFDTFRTGVGFTRICRLFATEAPAGGQGVSRASLDWPTEDTRPSELALALALAVAESAPLSTVTDFAQDLERRLNALIEPDPSKAAKPQFGLFLQSRTRQLELVRAVRYRERHRRLDVELECVRFDDPTHGAQLLAQVWNELDGIRPTVVEWLDHLTHTANADARQRIALMIGILARADFASVFDELIYRWIRDDHPATRDVADMALSVAVFGDSLQSTAREIVRDFARSSNAIQLRAAVELACGYTGSRIKGLALETLKAVGQSKHSNFAALIDIMGKAIEFMVAASLTTDDASLFDWVQLIDDLSEWVSAPDQKTPQRLPMYLFLRLLALLPLRAPPDVAGLLSLDAIVNYHGRNGQRASVSVLQTTARVFESALRDAGEEGFSPRAVATDILRSWMDEEPEETGDVVDPLLEFSREVYRACKTPRDCDRLVFALRRNYRREQIADLTVKPTMDIVARGQA